MDEEKFKETHQNAKNMVESIMTEHPETRDDDFLLCMHVWLKQGINIKVEDYKAIEDLINADTILRYRRQIQNKERRLLPTSEDVILRRKLKEKIIREVGQIGN